MKHVGTSPSVMTCLVCNTGVWATFARSQCQCGQVWAYGARIYLSYRKHGPHDTLVPALVPA